jgi:50S ribosomal protein L16 3-hydroxylase
MISYASTGGGVGPHYDSYDVFLLQASGRRRWRIGKQTDFTLQEGVPLKILQNFDYTEEFVLEAGDMLYLPPRYAHDGVAQDCAGADGKPEACMTYSIGFRAPGQAEIAGALLQRLAEYCSDDGEALATPRIYKDPLQPATANPAALPPALTDFARASVAAALKDPLALACALGEYLTEPKSSVWFEGGASQAAPIGSQALALDSRTRMMYDDKHIFINGESYRAQGADALLMRQLADQRALSVAQLRKVSRGAKDLLADWLDAGWLHTAKLKDQP